MDDEESTQVVNDSVAENTTETESTPVENEDSQADDTEDVSEVETEEASDDADEQDSNESDETETTDKPQSKGEQRKAQLNEEIRGLVAQRNAIRSEVEKANSQVYRPQNVQELLETVNPDTGEYYNRLEAQFEAMQQERAVEKYNQQVSDAQVGLSYEAQKAIEEFPMFDETSPEYEPALAKEVDQILAQSLQFDKRTGQIIGSSISPYQLYKSHAKAAKAYAAKAEVKAKKDTATMLTNADRPTGGKGKAAVPFERMSLKQQEAYLRKKGHDV